MPAVERVGDANSAGGVIMSGDPSVLVNGQVIAIQGSPVSPHPCCGRPGCGAHCAAVTTSSNFTVLINGIPVVLVGDVDTCGHPRATSSPDVFVG